jgi:hypothetical protein
MFPSHGQSGIVSRRFDFGFSNREQTYKRIAQKRKASSHPIQDRLARFPAVGKNPRWYRSLFLPALCAGFPRGATS